MNTYDTMGGRMRVRWDDTAQATPHGQIVFFAEFLATAGVFDRWVQGGPWHYTSPNASRSRDVLGTLMLDILAGSKRYAHIAGIRGDAVAAKALGLQGMVSEDSVRRALKAMEPAASEPWMRDALMGSVRDVLDRPWVLDMDATIKPLYGHQEGAEVGYNPHKSGRPSHVLHTFWIGNLRLVLNAVLSSGKQHSSGHAKAAMGRLLDELGPSKVAALVCGDCGYGNKDIIDVCEQRGLSYLLRLRKTDKTSLCGSPSVRSLTSFIRHPARESGCLEADGDTRLCRVPPPSHLKGDALVNRRSKRHWERRDYLGSRLSADGRSLVKPREASDTSRRN